MLPLERILTHCAIKFWIHNCLRVEFSKRMLNSYNNLLQTSNLQLDFFTTFCWVKNITVWNLSIRRKKDPRGEQKSCFDVFPHTFKIFFKLNNLPTPPAAAVFNLSTNYYWWWLDGDCISLSGAGWLLKIFLHYWICIVYFFNGLFVIEFPPSRCPSVQIQKILYLNPWASAV